MVENNGKELLFAILALAVSFIGNVAQFFLPIKKTKSDNQEIISATAKNIAEAYSMTLKSLNERILNLEEESKKDKETIQLLEKKVDGLEEKIEIQKQEIQKQKEEILSLRRKRK